MSVSAEIRFVVTTGGRKESAFPRATLFPTFVLRPVEHIDAGLSTTFELDYQRTPMSGEALGVVKIGVVNQLGGRTVLPSVQFSRLSSEYFSLGQSPTYYENFGMFERPTKILSALGDVVVSPTRLARVSSEPVFHRSLALDGRAVRALEDSPRLFHITKASSRSSFPLEWTAHLALNGFVSSLYCDFKPVVDGVPNRVLALVGANGSGKSMLLGAIAAAAVRSHSLGYGVEAISTPQGGAVAFSRVVTISYGAFDQSRIYGPDDPRSAATRHIYCGLRTRDKAGALTQQTKSIQEIEIELLERLRAIRSARRMDVLEGAINIINAASPLPERVVEGLISNDQNQLNLRSLSSGQAMVLNVIISLVAFLEPGSLVLVDEPEVHLHPPLISGLVRSIALSLDAFESVAIVATHSSVVLQELPARNVRVLHAGAGRIFTDPPAIETFGENLSKLDRHVFGMASVQTNYERVLSELGSTPSLEAAERAFGGELSSEARAVVLTLQQRRKHAED